MSASPRSIRFALAAAAFALAFLAAWPGRADSTLLGLCSEVADAGCTVSTSWTVQERAGAAQLEQPAGANASFQITVTEGASASTLQLEDMLSLDGLIESGTDVAAIYLSLQRGDGQGNFTTVASAAVGDTSVSCGCPYVQSNMTLAARDASSGAALQATPLLQLPFGAQETVALDLSWGLGQGLVQPGDALRVQPCVTYVPAQVSSAPGCYSDGGGVRAARACAPFSLGACQRTAQLSESIALSGGAATASGFVATTGSSALGPPSISQAANGASVSFTATPLGVPGAQSTINVSGQVSCGAAGGSATLTGAASVGGASASASTQISCLGASWSCGTLGAAAPYNLFAAQGVSAAGSDVEGALAAGGDVSLASYEVGGSLDGGVALVAGGKLSVNQGAIFGDVWVAGSVTYTAAGQTGASHSGVPFDVAGAAASLQALSSSLAALASRGTAQVQGGELILSGVDPVLDVFDVTGAQLGSSWGVSLQIPAAAFALVNVSGASAQMVDQAFAFGSTPPQQLLFNLPSATALTLNGIGLYANVLAPAAAVSFNNGVLQGSLLGRSFAGNGQLNLAPPIQCIPLPPPGGP